MYGIVYKNVYNLLKIPIWTFLTKIIFLPFSLSSQCSTYLRFSNSLTVNRVDNTGISEYNERFYDAVLEWITAKLLKRIIILHFGFSIGIHVLAALNRIKINNCLIRTPMFHPVTFV